MKGPYADWGWSFVTWPGQVTFLGTRGLEFCTELRFEFCLTLLLILEFYSLPGSHYCNL